MLERINHMLIKEFIQIFRDPRMKGVIFLMPLVQVLVFGYAVTTDVKHVATAVLDRDNSLESRELLARFARSGYFDLVAFPADDREARALLDRGKVQTLLRLDHGFGAAVRAGKATQPGYVQLVADGTDSNTAGIVVAYGARIVGNYAETALRARLTRTLGKTPALPGVVLASRAWFNENLESRNFYVPGVIAILVMLITLMLTSMAVVREKEIGTMEQIMVSPIRPIEFILGKTVPFALIGFADVILVTVVGVFWFGVPIRGSLPLLFLATGFYLMTTLGIGLLISTVSQTQQQAMMGTFFFYFPAVLLSGFMFPIANMPPVIQWFTVLNPLRYFLVVIRGVFLKGLGPGVLWPQLAALLAMGICMLAFASSRFQKTLS
ncbi:MAG: ABC transporter permease [Deltaproteobacteria bacterium]|nr:ABC transporter permease [Deltaproteobacteria bacterium]